MDAAALTVAGLVAKAREDKRDVEALLDGKGDGEPDGKRFRAAAAMVTKRVKIPESGIW